MTETFACGSACWRCIRKEFLALLKDPGAASC